MNFVDPSSLPELQLPAGTSPDIAEYFTSLQGIEQLTSRLQTQVDAGQRGAHKGQLRSLYERAQQAARYMRLRSQALLARDNIAADKAAMERDITRLTEIEGKARKAHAVAISEREATLQKIAKLNEEIEAKTLPDGSAVAEAQAAFDKAIATGRDDAQRNAAEKLDTATSELRQASERAVRHIAPLRIIVAAQGRRAEQQLAAIGEADAELERASEQVRTARYRLALVEADEATYTAALAHLCAWAAYAQSGGRLPAPLGFDSPTFWFASGRRALATSNVLTGMGPDGPVLLDGRVMSNLAGSAIAPDLTPFAGEIELH